jgi:hypothetical protein
VGWKAQGTKYSKKIVGWAMKNDSLGALVGFWAPSGWRWFPGHRFGNENDSLDALVGFWAPSGGNGCQGIVLAMKMNSLGALLGWASG